METIKLHELVKEASRSLRFIDDPLFVKTIAKNGTINYVPIKYMMEEKEHVPREDEIEFQKKIASTGLFGEIVKNQRAVDIKGKVLVLSRDHGLLEIEVIGMRYIPTLFQGDVLVIFKDPVQRDVAYVQETYPDAHDLLLAEIKRRIQIAVAVNGKKRVNLCRLIDYIDKIEGRSKCPDEVKLTLGINPGTPAPKTIQEMVSENEKKYLEMPLTDGQVNAMHDRIHAGPTKPDGTDPVKKKLFGLPPEIGGTVIMNAGKLDMTDEEFEKQRKKNEAGIQQLSQVNSDILRRHTTI